VVEGSLWITGLGGNGLSMMLMGAGILEQIKATEGLPAGLRAARITEIIGNAMFSLGLQVGAHLASRSHLRGIQEGMEGLGTRRSSLPEGRAPGAALPPPPKMKARAAGREAPPSHLEAALPPDVRRTTPLDMDPRLKGNTVQVEYVIGPNGRVDPGSIRMVAGPRATTADIAAHAETARTLHAYAGVLGAVHESMQKLRGFLQGQRAPEQGSAAWEAQMELAKLDGMLRARMKTTSRQVLDDAQAAEAAADIANLAAQLADAQRILAGYDPADPRGFIAAESAAQRGARIAENNRKVVAEQNIGHITVSKGVVTVADPVAGTTADPAPGYHFAETSAGPKLNRNPTAGDAPLLMLIEHHGRRYIAPQPEAGVTRSVHENDIRAQLDGYPPPRPGQHWAKEGDGWQLEGTGSDGKAMQIVKDGDKPARAADGSFQYKEREKSERRTYEDRKASAVATQPPVAERSAALEAALDANKVAADDINRAILRRWSETLRELGVIAQESQGKNLPSEPELADAATKELAKGLAADGSFIEPRYDDFRHVLRDAAIAAIFGYDSAALDRFMRNGTALPHSPRSAAEQRAIYDRLYAALPDSQSKGELWSRYRDMRGRLPASRGGFGDFVHLPIPTHLLQADPKTLIDGGIRVPADLGPQLPAKGHYALESKGGGSFDVEQSGRYSDNLTRNKGKLVGDPRESGGKVVQDVYDGIVYLFDSADTARSARASLDKNKRHPNIYVAYVDSAGQVVWIPRIGTP
jgi:hypothetical protein